MDKLIETHNLGKRFGQVVAVDGVDLEVRAGQVLALLGPNGAGKTTTIRMLASILRPSKGWARVAGLDVVQEPVKVRRSVGLLTEHHGLYTRMKALEYLTFFGRTYGLPERALQERILSLLERFDLAEALEMRLGQYSRGMRQKLALVRALLHDPPVLLLDEPTSAMDPASARKVRESILQLRDVRRAIVVCTHNLTEAEFLADRIAIIHQGRIVAQGSVPELKQRLLGDPIMEVRVARPLDGALSSLPQGIEVVATGADWLRYRTASPERDNPRLVEALARARVPVVTLAEVGRSLEEVYLRVVGEQPERQPR